MTLWLYLGISQGFFEESQHSLLERALDWGSQTVCVTLSVCKIVGQSDQLISKLSALRFHITMILLVTFQIHHSNKEETKITS